MRQRSFVLNAARTVAAASFFSTILAIFFPAAASANPADIPYSEQRILELHNAERAARGIRPLAADSRLQQVAEQWAYKLAGEGTIYHIDTLPARSFGYKAGGENIAYRVPSMTAEYAHMEWMKSDLHRKNILDPAFSSAGVGISCATVNGRYYTVAVVEFGADSKPSTSVPPLEPRAVTGDEYAGRPVTCQGFARPASPGPVAVAAPPAPLTATTTPVTAAPARKPASVTAAPKPAALVLIDVPPPGPPPVLAPPQPPEPTVTTPVAQAEPAADPQPAPEPGVSEPEQPAKAVKTSPVVAAPSIDSTAPVSQRNETAIVSGVFFMISLTAWLASGFFTSRKLRGRRLTTA